MSDELPQIPLKNFEGYPNLPFETIKQPLDDLLTAMENLIEFEWPQQYAKNEYLKFFLLGTVKITANIYKSIRYLCADKPADVSRNPELSISVSPLARTILDSVFTIVFLFNDIENRFPWYCKSGWREIYEDHKRYKDTYGENPLWTEYLGWQESFVNYGRCEWGISDEEVDNPQKNLPWWKNPGKMPSDQDTSEDRRKYLQYLNDWFYRNLSADSHLSWASLVRRIAHFIDRDEKQRLNRLKKYKSDCVVTAIALVLALLSEIECEFNFGRAERLQYVWGLLNSISDVAKELYQFRYAERLLVKPQSGDLTNGR